MIVRAALLGTICAALLDVCVAEAQVRVPPAVVVHGASEGLHRTAISRPDPSAEYLALLRGTRNDDAPPREQTLQLLQRVAPQALPQIFEWIHLGRLPAVHDGEREQILSEPQEALLLETLAVLGRHRVLSAADAWLNGRSGARERRTALVVGRAVADSRDFARLVSLAAPAPNEALDEALARQFELNLQAMFRRDPTALPAVLAMRNLVPAPLLASLAQALGASRDERAYAGLVLIWDREPELAPLIFAQVRQLPAPRDEVTTEEFANRLRRALDRLDPGSPVHVQALVFALGQLEDWRSVELLVPLLEHPARGVRDAALWSLRRISGYEFSMDPEHWRTWSEAELEWYAATSEALVERLASGDTARASIALREIVGHRLFRHPMVAALSALLDSGDGKARVAACQALEQLGSQRAQRALLERLEDRDKSVRDAAWQALVTLAGRDLPRTRPECAAELFPAGPVF